MNDKTYKKYATEVRSEGRSHQAPPIFAESAISGTELLAENGYAYRKITGVETEDGSFRPIDPMCEEVVDQTSPFFVSYSFSRPKEDFQNGKVLIQIFDDRENKLYSELFSDLEHFGPSFLKLIQTYMDQIGIVYNETALLVHDTTQENVSFIFIIPTIPEHEFYFPEISISLKVDDAIKPFGRIVPMNYAFHIHGFSQEAYVHIRNMMFTFPSIKSFSLRNNDFTAQQNEFLCEILMRSCYGNGRFVDLRGTGVREQIAENFIKRGWTTCKY